MEKGKTGSAILAVTLSSCLRMVWIVWLAGVALSGFGVEAGREGIVDGKDDDALKLFFGLRLDFVHSFLSGFGARK